MAAMAALGTRRASSLWQLAVKTHAGLRSSYFGGRNDDQHYAAESDTSNIPQHYLNQGVG